MNSPDLKKKFQLDLKKALQHLEYSFQKIQKMNLSFSESDEETLETLESFAARFARASDIFTSRYLRLLVLEKDPGFQGAFIDIIHFSEKFGFIAEAKTWFRIRELRNVISHEYTSEELQPFYQEMLKLTPEVLSVQKLL